jgi:hypothetical protein
MVDSPWHGRALGSTAGVPVDLLMARQALLIFADPAPGRVMHFQAKPSWKCRLASGNDLDACLDAVQMLDQGDSIYWGLNPVSSELKLSPSHRDVRASDVVCRRWLFLDPDRAKTLADLKLSATEEEKAAVMERARLLYDYTADELGWPVPVLTDSGNGAGLFWRIDLPNDKLSQALVRAVTHALGKRFNNDRVEIDPATHNADRVAKLPGSWSRKGPDTPERPHRQCKLLHVPETLEVLPLEALQALAGAATRSDSPKPAAAASPWQGKAGGTDRIAYARAALERECGRMACTAPGGLNKQLNSSGFYLGQLVGAGLLSEDEVFRALLASGKAAGCDSPQKDEDTLRRAIAAGKLEPRQVPERNGVASPATAKKADPVRQLPVYQPFPLSTLPPVLSDLVQVAAAAIPGCDPAAVALYALTVAAGCIGNSRALHLKRSWSEPCVLWSLVVAPSGQKKSPAYDAAVKPLVDLQMDVFDDQRRKEMEHVTQVRHWESLSKDGRGQRPDDLPEPATFLTADATVEAIGCLLEENPHGLLLARDELDAWFQSFTRYKGKSGGTDRPQWLEMHRAGPLRIDRLTREKRRLSVRRAAVSVTGTIQPEVLAAALDRDALHAGLGARFLMVMPPKKRARWTEADVPEELTARWSQLLRDLLDLPLADRVKRTPHFLGLATPAKRLWVNWYDEWADVQFEAEGAQAAAYAKLEAYAARLALLHHVVAHAACGSEDTCSVGEVSVSAGIEQVRWFAAEVVRIYAMLAETEEDRDRRTLTEFIRDRGGRITVRELIRANCRRWPDKAAAEAALGELVLAGCARWIEPPADQPGRPSRSVELCMTYDNSPDILPL